MSQLLSFISSFVLITILNIFISKKYKNYQLKPQWQHYLIGYIFMFYLIISLTQVVGFPSLTQLQRIATHNEAIFNPIINLIPFSDGFEISAILNIIFFIPFGFFLPLLWQKYKSFLPTLFQGILFSLIIEIGQLFVPYRATDITDLTMNALGTVLGWFIFKTFKKIFHILSTKSKIEISSNNNITFKLEPYIYIIIAIISSFLS